MGIKSFASNSTGYRTTMKKHCQNIIALLDEEQNINDVLKGQAPSKDQADRLADIKDKVNQNLDQLTKQNADLRK